MGGLKRFFGGAGLAAAGVVALEAQLALGLHPFSPVGWPAIGVIGGAALGGGTGLAGGVCVLLAYYAANLMNGARYVEFYSGSANSFAWLVGLAAMTALTLYLRREFAKLQQLADAHAASEAELRARLEFERALRLSQDQLHMVMDVAPALIAFVGTDLRIRLHNKAYEELLGLPADRIVGRHIREVIGEDAFVQTEPFAGRALAGESVEFERTQKLPDGTALQLAARFVPHRTDQGVVDGFVGVLVDITERKAMEEKIAALALSDPLTSLPNRRGLEERLAQTMASTRRRGSSFCLLYLDLDEFKPVNDRLGHEAGDLVLVEVAARLKAAIRASDIVARVGGDEFVVILADTPVERAVEKARAIIESIERPIGIPAASVRVGASIGIAVCPAHGTTIGELERNADAAMYAAKRAGRGRVVVYGKPDGATGRA